MHLPKKDVSRFRTKQRLKLACSVLRDIEQ